MRQKPINCITPRTDAEWSEKHPMRRVAGAVMTNADLAKFRVEEIALVCGKAGEPRLACPPDDEDVPASCFRCGCDLVRRKSANPAWQSVCFGCWEVLQR